MAQIREAIEEMDGGVRDLVTLEGPGGAHLAVGGGADDVFVLYATHDNSTLATPLGPTGGEGTVPVQAGGQSGEYARRRCVNRRTAIRAAIVFARNGELDSAPRWTSE